MDAIDPRPGPKGTVGEEIIAGDDRVDQSHGLREPPQPPGAFPAAWIVRVAIEDCVVEIEDEMPNGAPLAAIYRF